MEESKSKTIAIAIVFAGLIIAGAVIFGGQKTDKTVASAPSGNTGTHGANLRQPSQDDHIFGDPNAPITIIEFSDFECPFCGRLHPTLTQIVQKNPDVKWVYRHFPLSQIHSRAQSAAIASECVAGLGGNDAFWKFSETLFSNQNKLGATLYTNTARDLGVNETAFARCQKDPSIAQEVNTDLQEVISSGGRGTPYSIAMHTNGTAIPFSGALTYESIIGLVEQLRAQ